ncbi:uncharacterized protein LY79DRAFT_542037 [Colletotrichum navitas]|uniref:Uncharacterized protein n=1 Tax=Colletotrichum navitas TaxID=681940 RepID=A0AAD8Q7E5_9PEZI|nr:uncharacterized protein LY79DRAFT_542037 [Colletotrichum navitas]KAK1597054.1 hypothetical protein LY79DRAFT_542037 [Colletotrichum navitas]
MGILFPPLSFPLLLLLLLLVFGDRKPGVPGRLLDSGGTEEEKRTLRYITTYLHSTGTKVPQISHIPRYLGSLSG